MKLPGRTEGAVQELVGVDPGVYAQRGQAIAQLGGAVSDIATDWEERMGDRAYAKATLDYTNNMTRFETEHGQRRTFTKEEAKKWDIAVPERARYDHWVDENNKPQKTPKAEYNAEDIYPEALRKRMEAEAQSQAQQIPGKDRKARFLNREQELINKRYLQELNHAEAQREAKILTEYELNIEKAETAGNYPGAIQMVKDHPYLNQEEKDTEVLRLLKSEEKRYLSDKRRHGSDRDIYQEIYRLQDKGRDGKVVRDNSGKVVRQYGSGGNFHNSLTNKERESEVSKLQSTLDERESDRKEGSKAAATRAYLEAYDAMTDPALSREEKSNMIDAAEMRGATAAQLVKLREIRDGHGSEPDYDMQAEAINALHNPVVLSQTDPMSFKGFIPNSLLNELVAAKAKLGADPAGKDPYSRQIDEGLRAYGMADPTAFKAKDRRDMSDDYVEALERETAVRGLIQDEVDRFRDANNSRAPNRRELQDIIDGVLTDEVIRGVNKGRGREARDISFAGGDVPTQYIRHHGRVLSEHGVPVSDTNIWILRRARSYLRDAGQEATDENLMVAFRQIESRYRDDSQLPDND